MAGFGRQPAALNPSSDTSPADPVPSDPTSASAPTKKEEAHAISPWRRVALLPLTLLIRIWGRTLRLELSEEDVREVLERKWKALAGVKV